MHSKQVERLQLELRRAHATPSSGEGEGRSSRDAEWERMAMATLSDVRLGMEEALASLQESLPPPHLALTVSVFQEVSPRSAYDSLSASTATDSATHSSRACHVPLTVLPFMYSCSPASDLSYICLPPVYLTCKPGTPHSYLRTPF